MQQFVQFVGKFVAKFFALISDDLQRYTVPANPPSKDGFGHGDGLFVVNGDQLDIFGKCVRNYQYVFFVVPGSLERSV